jgi:hypothetical protein
VDGRGSTPQWCARISTSPAPATCHQSTLPPRSSRPRGGHRGARPDDTKVGDEPRREALGRSRGGLTTEIHFAADTRCQPISRGTTAGHRHDCLAFESVMGGIRIRRRGCGPPRTRPARVLGDKAYSNRAIRSHLRRRQTKATIPESAGHKQPSPSRNQRRSATTVRRRDLQETQRRRALHQPAQGLPRGGKPLRL